MMNLSAWLRKIESFHPQNIVLGLERVEKIATMLNLQSFNCPVVTVAGTNGKGSCVKILESILSAQNYRVGSYTSPHLLTFNERIRINNSNCQDQELISAFECIESAAGFTPLTFFEFTTLAALWVFKQANLDVLILEVGLGGRLDAVNIIDADIAVITTIALDHMDWLGHTLEDIALEKAGIFKPGKQAVIGEFNPPRSLIQQATQLNIEAYFINQAFRFTQEGSIWNWYDAHHSLSDLPVPCLPLQNAATALMVISLLKAKMSISYEAITNGLRNAILRGRFERQGGYIFDVAHNPASASLLAMNCSQLQHKGKLLAVTGMLGDKDISNTLKPLEAVVDHWYFGSLKVPRGATSQHLASAFSEVAKDNYSTYDCVSAAFEAAKACVTEQDCILVFGSFYTVATIFQHIQGEVT